MKFIIDVDSYPDGRIEPSSLEVSCEVVKRSNQDPEIVFKSLVDYMAKNLMFEPIKFKFVSRVERHKIWSQPLSP